MKITIVGGTGKMGNWAANFLKKEGHEIFVTGRDTNKLKEYEKLSRIKVLTDLKKVSDTDVIIISVPIDAFEEVAKQYSQYIEMRHTVIEITSVKKAPIEALHKYVKTDKILGIHPMFGPGASGVAGHNFILTPTNIMENTLASRVKEFLIKRGGIVSIMSPEEHDKTMAAVLGIPHFFALVSADTLLNLGNFSEMRKLGGTTCKLLLTLADSVLTEDPELYALIQTNIPGMGDLHNNVHKYLVQWADLVKANNKQGFIERMQSLREQRQKNDPDFGQAYDDMYRTLKH